MYWKTTNENLVGNSWNLLVDFSYKSSLLMLSQLLIEKENFQLFFLFFFFQANDFVPEEGTGYSAGSPYTLHDPDLLNLRPSSAGRADSSVVTNK